MSSRFQVSRALAIVISVALMTSAVPMLVTSVAPVENVSAQTGGYVQVGWMQKFQNWNPLNIELVSDWVATFNIYSSLFQYDENLDLIENHLATGYYQRTHAAGNMSTWINITESAYFRNRVDPTDTSHPVTAEDVKYTIELVQDNPGGCWDYYVANITGVNCTETYQVKIDTAYEKATLIDDLVWLPIVPKYWWDNPDNVDPKKVLFNMDPLELIGSGPFYFDSLQLNQWYKFTKAPNYHCEADYGEERDLDFEGVIYTIYSNTDGLRLAIETGAEDVIEITGAQTQTWEGLGTDMDNIIKQETTELGIYDICINAIPLEFRIDGQYCDGNPILLDKVVRKALGMTIDRDSLVYDYFGGRPTPADTVLNPGFWHADLASQTEVLPFNPEWAKQNLTAAGYRDTDADGYLEVTADTDAYKLYGSAVGDVLEFRLRVPDSDPGYATVGEAWVGWAEDAGIKLNFEVVTEGIMISFDWYKAYFDIWVWSWYWGPEPLSNLAVWRTNEVREGGDNCAGPITDDWYWVDEENKVARCSFDDVLEEAMRTVDKDARKVLVDELQVMIYDSYTEFPPIHPNGLYAMSTTDYVGWGDWETHLGRTIISDMLWLWYDLEPTSDNANPVFDTPLDNAYEVEVDEPAAFSVGVSDEEGNPITVTWSWGDETPDTTMTITEDTDVEQTVTATHTYAEKGDFTLIVSIVDDQHTTGNAEIATVTVVGEINLGPEFGTVTADLMAAYVGDEVTWTATAKDAEQGPLGEGLLFTWDWGDGTPPSVELIKPVANNTYATSEQTHTWDSPQTYAVKVSVWDGFDEETNTFHNVSVVKYFDVIENSAPSEPFVASLSGLEGVEVYCVATALDADPDVLTVTWDWHDGTYTVTTHDTSGAQGVPVTSVVTHTWDTQGTYDVTVYVDDGEGGDHNVSASAEAAILASTQDAPPGSISLTVRPYPPYVDEDVTLNISAYDANGDALTVTVLFGDGGSGVATTDGGTTELQYAEFLHMYDAEDTYTVTVYVDDDTTNVTQTFTVEVGVPAANRAPVVTLPSSYTFYLGVEKEIMPVDVYDPEDDPLSVWYDWGDGSPVTEGGDEASGYSASHVYTDDGTYTLQVFADDGQGHNATASSSVSVQEANRRPKVVDIGKDPMQEVYGVGETITFEVVISDNEGDDVEVVIEFGDDSNESLDATDLEPDTNKTVSFTHEYDEEGLYTVTVTVKDDQLHSDPTWLSSETTVEVEAETAGGLSDTAMIVIALVAILIIVAVVVMMMKGRKKRGEKGMEGMSPPATPAEGPPPPSEPGT